MAAKIRDAIQMKAWQKALTLINEVPKDKLARWKDTSKKSHGHTPLHEAASANAPLSSVLLLLEKHPDVNATGRRGITPIRLAAFRANTLRHELFDLIPILLQHGADPSIKDKDNSTPLHGAIRNGASPELLRLLFKHGADANARNAHGYVPLHDAIRTGSSPAVIRTLFEHGANACSRDKEGNTPLHYAAQKGASPDIFQILFENGADLSLTNTDGTTPLHDAARHGASHDVVQILLQLGANLSLKDRFGWTPLHYITNSWRACPEMTRTLLRHGADISATGNNGRTPLHNASNPEVIRVLFEHGADPFIKDNDGRSALQIARHNKRRFLTEETVQTFSALIAMCSVYSNPRLAAGQSRLMLLPKDILRKLKTFLPCEMMSE